MATAKLGQTITAYGFKGMNNLPDTPAILLDRERQITPRIVLNADVTDRGAIQARGGYVLKKALTNPHSVAGEECGLSIMLCVADGDTWPTALYKIEGEVATELCEMTGPRAQVNYAEINGVIYASNPYWKATYDLLTGIASSWGVPLPLAPDIALVAGDLPPGTYSLCYTNVIGSRLGGNGPVTKIRWEGNQQGIQLNNLPPGALCWITQPNGKELLLAPISGGVVSAQSPYMKPLPSFMVQPPPGFTHFIYNFGRIWGALNKKVYYSDPFQYEWFRPKNFFPFQEDIVLLAPVTGGFYANSLANTWFIQGDDPSKKGEEPGKMTMRRVGNGAIPGTLSMAQVPANIAGGAQTSELFALLSKMPTPVWMSPTGWVVGTHGGNLTYLTENRLKIQARTQGASLYRITEGVPRVIVTLRGIKSKGETDEVLDSIFTYGQLTG